MTETTSFSLSIITPCYNEQCTLEEYARRMVPLLDGITPHWEILLIDDGSRDATFSIMERLTREEPRIRAVRLSRNFGKEAALTAGIDLVSGDAVIPIDVDLQDPPEVIPEMVRLWREDGFDVVLATRRERKGESWLKKRTAAAFYKLISMLADSEIPSNTGDFRLLDRKVVRELRKLREKNRFMKGIFSWPGFSITRLHYDRDPRFSGKSKWKWRSLLRLALDGIFSFSTKPLKMWTYIGSAISILAFLYLLYTVGKTLIFGVEVPGYASVISVVLFLGGIQLVSLGIMGEYVARIYEEAKDRPIYVIDRTLGLAASKAVRHRLFGRRHLVLPERD